MALPHPRNLRIGDLIMYNGQQMKIINIKKVDAPGMWAHGQTRWVLEPTSGNKNRVVETDLPMDRGYEGPVASVSKNATYDQLIKLGAERPELQDDIRPILDGLKQAGRAKRLPRAYSSGKVLAVWERKAPGPYPKMMIEHLVKAKQDKLPEPYTTIVMDDGSKEYWKGSKGMVMPEYGMNIMETTRLYKDVAPYRYASGEPDVVAQLVRLGTARPELRPDIRPILAALHYKETR